MTVIILTLFRVDISPCFIRVFTIKGLQIVEEIQSYKTRLYVPLKLSLIRGLNRVDPSITIGTFCLVSANDIVDNEPTRRIRRPRLIRITLDKEQITTHQIEEFFRQLFTNGLFTTVLRGLLKALISVYGDFSVQIRLLVIKLVLFGPKKAFLEI